MSPEGVLHLVPDVKRERLHFCKQHGGLRWEYIKKYSIDAGTESAGWQLLSNIRYLQQRATGAILVVVGTTKRFFDARAAACARAGLEPYRAQWMCAGVLRRP